MKKLIYIICTLTIIGGSCDTDCNDCGPTGYTRYSMFNNSGGSARLYWFGNTSLSSNLAEDTTILAGDTLLLYESSLTGTSGLLSTPPFNSITPYDSIRLETSSGNTTYLVNRCNLTGNPLCEGNYQLIKSVDTKDKKIKEWLLEIK